MRGGICSHCARDDPPADPGTSGSLSPDVQVGLPRRFEAVAEALVSGSDVLRRLRGRGPGPGPATAPRWRRRWPACGRPGASVRGCDPSYDAIAALLVGWSETTLSYFHALSCEDPMTGLSTPRRTCAAASATSTASTASADVARRLGAGRVRDGRGRARRARRGEPGAPLRPLAAAGPRRGGRAHGVRRRRDGRPAGAAPGRGRRLAATDRLGTRVRLLRSLVAGLDRRGRRGSGSRACPAPTWPPRSCSTSSPAA